MCNIKLYSKLIKFLIFRKNLINNCFYKYRNKNKVKSNHYTKIFLIYLCIVFLYYEKN